MAIVFLIGGTGNQLFQFSNSNTNDRFSTAFLSRPVRWVLGWTRHEQLFRFEAPSLPIHTVALIALLIDIGLAKIIGKSLFTEFDLRRFKAQPRIRKLGYMGYAQTSVGSRDLAPIVNHIGTRADLGPGSVVLHIRGGDLVKLEAEGRNTYGMLGAAYYQAALMWSQAELEKKGRRVERVIALTDDPEHAANIIANLSFGVEPEIASIPLMDTFSTALSAEYFMSSNSTMSYWILAMRKGEKSVAPTPFMKRDDMQLPKSAHRIPANFST